MHPLRGRRGKRKSLDFSRLFRVGGRNRTRTCDPIDVNDVLYQLSHATIQDFYEVTSRYYQLSHATIYVNRFLDLALHVISMDIHRIGGAFILFLRFFTSRTVGLYISL